MIGTNRVILGILIMLAFLWRLTRTRQLYLTSLAVQRSGSDPIVFNPHDLRTFLDQALLGQRSLSPVSFFVRAVVFLFVALILLSFKHYDPVLFWLVILLFAIHVSWCVVHGFMLQRQIIKIKSG